MRGMTALIDSTMSPRSTFDDKRLLSIATAIYAMF